MNVDLVSLGTVSVAASSRLGRLPEPQSAAAFVDSARAVGFGEAALDMLLVAAFLFVTAPLLAAVPWFGAAPWIAGCSSWQGCSVGVVGPLCYLRRCYSNPSAIVCCYPFYFYAVFYSVYANLLWGEDF